MTFTDALKLLKEGEKITRPSYERFYFRLLSENLIITCFKNDNYYSLGAPFYKNEIEADDWIEYKE